MSMKLARLGAALFVLLVGISFNMLPVAAQTTGTVPCPDGEVKYGVCFPTGTGLSEQPIIDIVGTLMNWLLGIFGFLAVIAFVISGIQYLTAAGNEKQIDTAKKNMQYSIIGIIVALSGLVVITAVGSALNADESF